jgi:hypothetical protein
MRAKLKEAADLLQRFPGNRERSLAATHIEEVQMWSNKSLARNCPVAE